MTSSSPLPQPKKYPEAQKALLARVDQALSDLASAVNDADYYCSDYTTKEQPRLASLWITLAGSIKKLKEELSNTSLNEQYKDVIYRAKRSVFRLMTSCTQGMQKGMPEMVSFLLGEREFYCTHSFCSLYLYPLVGIARAELSPKPADANLAQGSDGEEVVVDAPVESFELVRVNEEESDKLTFLNQRLNYSYRPEAMEPWPLHFFVAGTIIHKKIEASMAISTDHEEFFQSTRKQRPITFPSGLTFHGSFLK